jgi:hypothetical protein
MHMRKGTVSRMRERYAQTVLTFRITFVSEALLALNHKYAYPVHIRYTSTAPNSATAAYRTHVYVCSVTLKNQNWLWN